MDALEGVEKKLQMVAETLKAWQLKLETEDISGDFVTQLLYKVDSIRHCHVNARATLMELDAHQVLHNIDGNGNDVNCGETKAALTQKRQQSMELVDRVASQAIQVYKMLLRKTHSYAPFMQYWCRMNNMTVEEFAGGESWDRQYAYHVMFNGTYAANETRRWSDIGITNIKLDEGFTDLDGFTYGDGRYDVDCDCGCQIAVHIYNAFTLDTPIYAGFAERYDYRIHLKDYVISERN